jgi:hypothetical protein
MKQILLFTGLCIHLHLQAQSYVALNRSLATTATLVRHENYKTKSASYSSLGYNHALNYKDIIIGGTSTVYKKFGTFINYKVGIQNFLLPTQGERGQFTYENASTNGSIITGRTENSVAFSVGGGLTIAITKRMPLYFGAGAVRSRTFFEYVDITDNKPKWNMDERSGKIELNYTAGIFIPLWGRLVLNLAYDHKPQCVFLGLAISSPTNFEDADEWWYGN